MVETIMVMLEISHRIQCLRVQNTCGNFSVGDLRPLLSFWSALLHCSSQVQEWVQWSCQPSCPPHCRQEVGKGRVERDWQVPFPLLRNLSVITSLMLHWLHLAVLKTFFFWACFLFYCGISTSHFNLVICNSFCKQSLFWNMPCSE